MSQNLIMVDSAPIDPRSVSAMLHNHGDGRELIWQSFADAYPTLPQEAIMEKFRLEARYGRIEIKNRYTIISSRKWLVVLIGLAIILA